ncbi:MAG: hypothetical protein R2711_04305 [Acidimicrobiales bacterium]
MNAVLRKIAAADDAWPSDAVRLSYPDWVLERLVADLGETDALGALTSMNGAAPVAERADGYVQDPASQRVVDAVGARPGERVLDLCAAPGGKATGLAGTASVVAADVRPARAGLVRANAERLGLAGDALQVVVADGQHPPFGAGTFDRILVDRPARASDRSAAAPTPAGGSTRRRPSAWPGSRWPSSRPPRRSCGPAAPSSTPCAP